MGALTKYKAYIAAAGLVLYAVGGFLSGHMDANQSMEFLMTAGVAFGIGSAVSKGR